MTMPMAAAVVSLRKLPFALSCLFLLLSAASHLSGVECAMMAEGGDEGSSTISDAEAECVAEAFTETDPNNAAAEAVANAVAQTFTQVVNCEEGLDTQNPNDVSGLAVAISVSISEASSLGQECIADAEASAEFATDLVTDTLVTALMNNTADDVEQGLADAWLTARGPDVADSVRDQVDSRASTEMMVADGCIDLSSLQDGLPSAVELAAVLADAIGQINEAVDCGTNLEPGDDPCIWQNRMFIGDCVPGSDTGTGSGTVPVTTEESGMPATTGEPGMPATTGEPGMPATTGEPGMPATTGQASGSMTGMTMDCGAKFTACKYEKSSQECTDELKICLQGLDCPYCE